MRFLELSGAVGLMFWMSSPAFACGDLPSPYLTVQEVAPRDGSSDFPRNGALQVRLKVWPGDGTFPVAEVSVDVENVATGEVVAGTLDNEDLYNGAVNWIPRAPLAAKQSYRIRVRSAQQQRSDIVGPTTSLTTFTTSDALAPELRLTGKLKITVRAGTAPRLKCGPCGDCTEIGRRPAVMADVVMPTVRGGFDANGYKAWLTLNDDEAPVFNGPGVGTLTGEHSIVLPTFFRPTSGMLLTHSIELPREDEPYVACFGFNAWDPISQFESAEPVCLTKSEVEAAFAQLDRGVTPPAVDIDMEADAGDNTVITKPAVVPRSADTMHNMADAGEAHPLSVHDDAGTAPAAAPSSGCSASRGASGRSANVAWLGLALIAFVRRRAKGRGGKSSRTADLAIFL